VREDMGVWFYSIYWFSVCGCVILLTVILTGKGTPKLLKEIVFKDPYLSKFIFIIPFIPVINTIYCIILYNILKSKH
jgi:hypothetical protein